MIKLKANKNNLEILNTELLTSGSLNVNFIQFILSADWEDLDKIVCFRISGKGLEDIENPVTAIDSKLDDDQICVLPFEMTRYADVNVQVGIYGIDPETCQVILPTIWGSIGNVREGVRPVDGSPCDPEEPDQPPIIEDPDKVTATEVVEIIKSYNKANPVRYDTIIGVPEPISNKQLEELLK